MLTVKFVHDHEIPDGLDWMAIEVDSEVVCVLRRSRLCEQVIEEAWVGCLRLAA